MERLNKTTLEDSIELLLNIFPLEEDHRWIKICLRSSLNGSHIEGVKDLEYFIEKEDSKPISIIGLYSLFKDYKEALWIGWFGVDPEYRNKGLGTKLLNFSIKESKKRGAEYLRLYTSPNPDEKKAHKLYEKKGFKKFKEESYPVTGYGEGIKKFYYELKL